MAASNLVWPSSGVLIADSSGQKTGRGVRIAILDSGVHASHPHVAGGVLDGVAINGEGRRAAEYVDRLGHGTAVAAAIREKAPEAELLIAKVFDRDLQTSITSLVSAMAWAVEREAHLINLSLGTANPAHEAALRSALEAARLAGCHVVAAGTSDNVRWLPGSLPGAIAVTLDWTCPRHQCLVSVVSGRVSVRASGFPRPIPGVPPERNLSGLSFAVANATGLVATAMTTS